MRDMTIGGPMSGVAGIGECETCRWASVFSGERMITTWGGTVILQKGESIIDCLNTGDKSITLGDGPTRCTGWAPKEGR